LLRLPHRVTGSSPAAPPSPPPLAMPRGRCPHRARPPSAAAPKTPKRPAAARRSCHSCIFTLLCSSPHAFAILTSAASSHPHRAPATSLLRLSALSIYPTDELAVSPHVERRSCPRTSHAPPPMSHRPFTSAFMASSRTNRPVAESVLTGATSFFASLLPRFDHTGSVNLLSHGSLETAASHRYRLGHLAEW
jgi:hypothetical protein